MPSCSRKPPAGPPISGVMSSSRQPRRPRRYHHRRLPGLVRVLIKTTIAAFCLMRLCKSRTQSRCHDVNNNMKTSFSRDRSGRPKTLPAISSKLPRSCRRIAARCLRAMSARPSAVKSDCASLCARNHQTNHAKFSTDFEPSSSLWDYGGRDNWWHYPHYMRALASPSLWRKRSLCSLCDSYDRPRFALSSRIFVLCSEAVMNTPTPPPPR